MADAVVVTGAGEVVRFRVSGCDPVAVDMPTMWLHNLTNVGGRDLVTLFRSHDRHDPAKPDTRPGKVSPA